jgi:hypothetical protein
VARAISRQNARDAGRQRAARTAREQRAIQHKLDEGNAKPDHGTATCKRVGCRRGSDVNQPASTSSIWPTLGAFIALISCRTTTRYCVGSNKLKDKVASIDTMGYFLMTRAALPYLHNGSALEMLGGLTR